MFTVDLGWHDADPLSSAKTPMPDSGCHFGLLLDERLAVHATWRVDSYKEKLATSLFGYYDYALAGRPGAWRIARKKITLVSDCVPSYFDVYQV